MAPTRGPNSTCPHGLSGRTAFIEAYHAHVLAAATLRIGEPLRLKKTAAEAAQVFAAERDLTVARNRLGRLSHWCNTQPTTTSSSLLAQSRHRPAISNPCKFVPGAFHRAMHRQTRITIDLAVQILRATLAETLHGRVDIAARRSRR
jgi:hypothetical protein